LDATTTSVRLELRAPIRLWWVAVLLGFIALGSGSALIAVASVGQGSAGWIEWVALVVAVLLGGAVGASCSIGLVQHLLHALVPTLIEADQSTLRMSAWNTWGGLLDGLRRVRTTMPACEVVGAALSTGQGGESHLMIRHSSGLSFSTGWSGTKQTVTERSEPLMRWIGAVQALRDPEKSR
jgi:hypothetical protein